MTANARLDSCFLKTLHCIFVCFLSAPSRPSTAVIAWSAASAVFILVILVISILLWHRRAKNKGNMEDLSYDKLNWTNQVFFCNLQIVRNSLLT